MKKITVLAIMLQIVSVVTSAERVNPNGSSSNSKFPSGCTVITISKGDRVFFGGNDDYINPDSYYWVDPGDSVKYGVIWIGTPDNPQQGVNEKGLAYDANGLPRYEVNPHTERTPVAGVDYHNYVMQIMHECSTVEEVIEWVNTHQRFPYMHDQLHFADKSGDAVIISAGADGEIAFTRKSPGDGFLVSTNFNVVNPSNGFNYPCLRYNKATEMLSSLVESDEPLTYQDVVSVMDEVHQEKPSWTIETMVADLANGVVYLYYFYQYDKPVVLNVKDELLNPGKPGPLSHLFPEEVRQEAARRYDKIQAGARLLQIIAISWLVSVVLCLILFFTVCREHKHGFKIWLPAIIVLGPFAIILRFIVTGNYKKTYWRKALIETLINLIPLVVSYTLAIVILILILFSGKADPLLQISLMFGLPLIVSLLFRLIYLGSYSSKNIRQLLSVCLFQVLVATFLGLGGIIPVAMPLINRNLVISLIAPLSPVAVVSWWAIVAAGSVMGGLFIFLYEYWSVTKGYLAWNVLVDGEGELTAPTWRKFWWWIIVSIVVLFLGLVVGIRLT
jgi:hypothetical protein